MCVCACACVCVKEKESVCFTHVKRVESVPQMLVQISYFQTKSPKRLSFKWLKKQMILKYFNEGSLKIKYNSFI